MTAFFERPRHERRALMRAFEKVVLPRVKKWGLLDIYYWLENDEALDECDFTY